MAESKKSKGENSSTCAKEPHRQMRRNTRVRLRRNPTNPTVGIEMNQGMMAWLGDDHGLDLEQIQLLERDFEEIISTYPGPDNDDEREAALIVAYRITSGDRLESLVAELGDDLLAAEPDSAEYLKAIAGTRQAATMIVTNLGEPGDDDVQTIHGFTEATGITGVDLVREWIGK